MSKQREPMTRHKEEQFNEPWVKEDVRFDEQMLEPHDPLMDPQTILKIENATDFLILRDNVFVKIPQYGLFGVKFGCYFALGAGQLTYRYEGPDFVVVTNQLTKEVVKFIVQPKSQAIAEVIKNVV